MEKTELTEDTLRKRLEDADQRIGKVYRNRKTRNLYVVIGASIHSETGLTLITYIKVEPSLALTIRPISWSRPIVLFDEKFEELEE